MLSLCWALAYLAVPAPAMGVTDLPPVAVALAHAAAAGHLALAYLFWWGGAAPTTRRGAVYGAVLFMALRTAHDLYGVLVHLPPTAALISLIDLVLSVTLLVGLLEAMSRAFKAPAA